MTAGKGQDVARQIARGISHLHDKGVVHGDLKPLNIVRVKAPGTGEDRWLLIDLDAASEVDKGFVGLKSSTAVRNTLYTTPMPHIIAAVASLQRPDARY